MRSIHSNIEQSHFSSQEDSPSRLLHHGASVLDIALSDDQKYALLRHNELLRHWNRRVNLTAITNPSSMVVEHLLDSMAIAPWLQGNRVLDVGSGGGFPGIPLAIVQPWMAFTLLDSRGKRVEFLRHTTAALRLANATAIKARVESFRPEQKFDTLVCRACAPFEQILALTSHLHIPGACLLAMKGKIAYDEIAVLPARWRRVIQIEPLKVPFLDAERYVVRVQFD